MKLRRSSWLARAAVLLTAAASWVFGSSFLFIGPLASQSLPVASQHGQSDRGSLISRHAREVDEEEVLFNFRKPSKKKGFDPNWKRPFPKYIVMGGVMMTFIGYLGGGPILSAVWGLCGAADLKPKPYAVIPPFLQPKKPMAVLRIVSLCMLLCCSEAMFKKDMRTVMEEEWPDMKHLGDVVSQATDKAKAIVHQGQEAVEGIKDLALDTFEAAAAKVNQSLKVVGQEVRDMNTTAMKEIISLDDKVKSAKNKAATFAAGTSAVLEQIQPIFEQFLEQLHSVTKMATDALNSISQEKAVMSLDKAMDKVFATASPWKFAMQDLAEKLQQMNESLSGYTPEEKVERPGAARRHERQADRQASRADSNLTNSTEPKPTVAALVQSMAMDPVEELSKTLKGPMKELKSAAAKLNDMAEEVTGAMGSFVDGALEAAKSKLPKSLMANVTEVLKGVQHEAMQELEPLGEVGQSIVSGLKKAGTDAGLDFDSGVAARLPLTLLMGLAMAFIGFA